MEGQYSRQSIIRQMGGTRYALHLADYLTWMDSQDENSVHAIVTDPPYGLKEYTIKEKQKLRSRRGGVWRIPPSFDGCDRNPVPRFSGLKLIRSSSRWRSGQFLGLLNSQLPARLETSLERRRLWFFLNDNPVDLREGL